MEFSSAVEQAEAVRAEGPGWSALALTCVGTILRCLSGLPLHVEVSLPMMPSSESGVSMGMAAPSVTEDAGALFRLYRDLLGQSLPGPVGALGTFAVSLHCRDWSASLGAARAVLSGPEQRRADRLRREKDRQMHVMAYAFHRMTLACALEVSPVDVPLTRDDNGCPRLPGTSWHTSLSHADGSVAIAVSQEGPVGIDLEAGEKAALMPGLIDTVCTQAERRDLMRAPDLVDRALLELWVRKEALLKACGLGMALDMACIEVPSDSWLSLPEDGRRVQARMLPAGDGHVVALVSTSPSLPPCAAWLAPGTGLPSP